MDTRELLTDAFHRIPPLIRRHAEGADDRLLHTRPDPEANSLAWLLWHTIRQQDAQVAELAGRAEVWAADGWRDRFDLALEPDDHGYGHDADQVALVRVDDVDLLGGYQDAVTAMIDDYLATATAEDLDRVVDDRYDPPVTAGVRLVSVVGDAMQHLGQAGYLRGLLERSG
ncbi:DinB family protein [Egicoccus sp. AB-alg6-2]|uniref:mycothiol transferase n=1 Tax=Egicoccus sp. AB-alg6-2 TaxID=3242692 RepID=UPI00359CC380